MAITGQFAQYLPFPVDYGTQQVQTYGDQADATGKTVRDAYMEALGRAQAANDISSAASLYNDIGQYLSLPQDYYRRNIEGVTDPATKQYMLTEAQYREAATPTTRRIAELTYNPQEKGLNMYDYVPLGSANAEKMQEWANKSQAFQLAQSVRPENYATFADYMQAVRQEGASLGGLKALNSGEVEVYAKDWYDHVKSSMVPGYVPTQETVARGNYTMDDAGNVYFTAAGSDKPALLGGTNWTRQGGLNAADIYNVDSPNAYFGPIETTQGQAPSGIATLPKPTGTQTVAPAAAPIVAQQPMFIPPSAPQLPTAPIFTNQNTGTTQQTPNFLTPTAAGLNIFSPYLKGSQNPLGAPSMFTFDPSNPYGLGYPGYNLVPPFGG